MSEGASVLPAPRPSAPSAGGHRHSAVAPSVSFYIALSHGAFTLSMLAVYFLLLSYQSNEYNDGFNQL